MVVTPLRLSFLSKILRNVVKTKFGFFPCYQLEGKSLTNLRDEFNVISRQSEQNEKKKTN